MTFREKALRLGIYRDILTHGPIIRISGGVGNGGGSARNGVSTERNASGLCRRLLHRYMDLPQARVDIGSLGDEHALVHIVLDGEGVTMISKARKQREPGIPHRACLTSVAV